MTRRILRSPEPCVETDWYPNVDSTLFNYYVDVVAETIVPPSSWPLESKDVIAIAVHVGLCDEQPHLADAHCVAGTAHYALSSRHSRVPLSIPPEITPASVCERNLPLYASMFGTEA